MWRVDHEWREELHTESLPSVVIGEDAGDLSDVEREVMVEGLQETGSLRGFPHFTDSSNRE